MKIICVFILISLGCILCQNDCGTPVECYAKAIQALDFARKQYLEAAAKMDAQTQVLKEYVDLKITESSISLSNTFNTQLKEGIQSVQTYISSVNDNLTNNIRDVNNKVHSQECYERSTNCADDGKGSFVFADRHNVACENNETMKQWKWLRCGDHAIRVVFTCCVHPQ